MRYNPRIIYRGHSIIGDKNSGYFSSVLGRDIHGKTISEVKDKIHRLEYGGLPRKKSNPRRRRAKINPINMVTKNIVPIAAVGAILFFLLRKKKVTKS